MITARSVQRIILSIILATAALSGVVYADEVTEPPLTLTNSDESVNVVLLAPLPEYPTHMDQLIIGFNAENESFIINTLLETDQIHIVQRPVIHYYYRFVHDPSNTPHDVKEQAEFTIAKELLSDFDYLKIDYHPHYAELTYTENGIPSHTEKSFADTLSSAFLQLHTDNEWNLSLDMETGEYTYEGILVKEMFQIKTDHPWSAQYNMIEDTKRVSIVDLKSAMRTLVDESISCRIQYAEIQYHLIIDDESSVYVPTWCFTSEDNTLYRVNAVTGELLLNP